MVVATDDASGLPPGSAHAASNTTPAPAAKGQRAIDAKVLSLGYDAKEAEVHSVDSVRSVAGSVLVLVRGALVGKGDAAKKDSTTRFSQAFVLAPQENGYFVLSDIVRFAPAAGPSGAAAGVAPAAKSAGPNAGGGAADAAGPANAKADAEKAANADANADAKAGASGARASPPPTLPQPSLSLEALEAKQRAAADAAAATTEAGSAAPAAAPAAPEPAPAIVEPKTYAERLKMKARMAAPPPITPAPPSSLVPAVSGPTPTPSAAVPPAAHSKAQVARPPAVLGAPKGGVATGTTVNPRAVFARGLTEAATAESIRAAFAPFGVVKEGSAGVQIRPRKNGNERYAFVEFESPEGAAAAMRATVELDGVALGVEGKREKIGGGEGGGGGGGGGGAGGGDRRRGGPGGAEGGHERGGGRGGEGGGRGGRGGRGGGRGRGGGAREGQGEGGVRRISEEAFLKRDERERVFRHLILPPGSTDPSESSSPPNSSARQDSRRFFLSAAPRAGRRGALPPALAAR